MTCNEDEEIRRTYTTCLSYKSGNIINHYQVYARPFMHDYKYKVYVCVGIYDHYQFLSFKEEKTIQKKQQ